MRATTTVDGLVDGDLEPEETEERTSSLVMEYLRAGAAKRFNLIVMVFEK